MKNFSQNFGKIALCGVVGSERKIRGFGNFPTSKMQRIFGKGYFPMLAIQFSLQQTMKGRERNGRKQDIKNSGFIPQKGNPLHETVTYKIGGTIFEVSTICGGSELLYNKMERLIRAESVKTPTDKEKEVRYNKDSNLFVGRSLQEE